MESVERKCLFITWKKIKDYTIEQMARAHIYIFQKIYEQGATIDMRKGLSKSGRRSFSNIQRQYMWILLISFILYILCTSMLPFMAAIALKSRFIILPVIILYSYCQHVQKVCIDYASIVLFGLGTAISSLFSDHAMNAIVKALTIILMFFACSAYFSINRINTVKTFFWVMRKVSYFIILFNLLYLVIGRGMFLGFSEVFFK